MKHILVFLMLLITIVSSGCSTMNSDFSCNKTAGDSCLTIEQVDAMTRFADGNEATNGNLNPRNKKGRIWVAPGEDKQGRHHDV